MSDKDLRLLSLDGGGVRGLSALMILKQLMEIVGPENPPKPCEYFDMIGGTSTGGLIAIMLGRLQMSVDECITAYNSLSERIFQKKRHRVTTSGGIQGRFDSEELSQAVKDVIKARGLPANTLLKDESNESCKVFVCATSKETSRTVCLTTYKPPRGARDLFDSVQIWEACRATSAASSFFDPIAIGKFKEEFVDGATGANNPIWEVWDQARLLWGPLEDKIKCLVSIGTGIPSLKPFGDRFFSIPKFSSPISETLVQIATETESEAERFRRDKSHLHDGGQYYRFNVDRGLDKIGLEESKKIKEIAAATRLYIDSEAVSGQMHACADNLAKRKYFGKYHTVFSLQGIPIVSKFIERPNEMAELEKVLLPQRHNRRRKMFVLHGLGGIGKTQLAVEFARRHHQKFSAVFWLDGSTKDKLLQSIADCASRIPRGQISESSTKYSTNFSGNIDMVVQEVMGWLAQPDNTDWLLILDNVDRYYNNRDPKLDPDAYDISHYLSGADHGSILLTTRLAKLAQLGDPLKIDKVDRIQAEEIFRSRYKKDFEHEDCQQLLSLLDGLPLAIAQAAAFLQESGIELQTYIKLYEREWDQLMESNDWAGDPIRDYPNRCVCTTWTLSYNAIRQQNPHAANLLLLWAFLDNKDLWYEPFRKCNESREVAQELSIWIGDLASSEAKFAKAIQSLYNYSLTEGIKVLASYSTHPVVHKWAYYSQDKEVRSRLARLALIVVGCGSPNRSTPDFLAIERRILPHAQAWIRTSQGIEVTDDPIVANAFFGMGYLYEAQGRLAEAEGFYERALHARETLFGSDNKVTLYLVNNLGILYKDQGKLMKAEEMLQRALQGSEKAYGSDHPDTLDSINNLGSLYADQGNLIKAEEMFNRALEGKERVLSSDHPRTLRSVQNLGIIYSQRGDFDKAQQMYERALEGREKALGPEHPDILRILHNLGCNYVRQGKFNKAEQMFHRALEGYEKGFGADHLATLDTLSSLGSVYLDQGELNKAEQMVEQSLQGFEKALGAEQMSTYAPAMNATANMAEIREKQGDLITARDIYSKALEGRLKGWGPEHPKSQALRETLHDLEAKIQSKAREDGEGQGQISHDEPLPLDNGKN